MDNWLSNKKQSEKSTEYTHTHTHTHIHTQRHTCIHIFMQNNITHELNYGQFAMKQSHRSNYLCWKKQAEEKPYRGTKVNT